MRACRLVGVYDANRSSGPWTLFHAYKLVSLCDLLDGHATPSGETNAAAFFSCDDLPGKLSNEHTFSRHLKMPLPPTATRNRPCTLIKPCERC